VLYAIDGPRVVALDPATGAELWSWAPPSGVPLGPAIVTDSHLFVSTGSTVYAVDVYAHASAWSYPAGGSLALGDGNLYVAQQNGTLVAIAAEPVSPAPPESLEIRGPDDATEFTSVQYRTYVHYTDGRVRERTHTSAWSIAPTTYASIDGDGVLAVREMLDLSQQLAMSAQYTEAGVTVSSSKPVEIHVSVPRQQFIERNRLASLAIQRDVLLRLADALARERAILRALAIPPESAVASHPDPFVARIVQAILAGEGASFLTHVAVDRLEDAAPAP
jgi:PQQ-like domain